MLLDNGDDVLLYGVFMSAAVVMGNMLYTHTIYHANNTELKLTIICMFV